MVETAAILISCAVALLTGCSAQPTASTTTVTAQDLYDEAETSWFAGPFDPSELLDETSDEVADPAGTQPDGPSTELQIESYGGAIALVNVDPNVTDPVQNPCELVPLSAWQEWVGSDATQYEGHRPDDGAGHHHGAGVRAAPPKRGCEAGRLAMLGLRSFTNQGGVVFEPAVWLLGIAADQPVEYRRLRRIRRRIYSTVGQLEAEIVRSPEPIAFDDLDRSAFAPLRPGTSWGKIFDCAWLRITGPVPAGVTDPVVLLGIRGEGLAVAADGTILDGISTVFQQGDLPHSGGAYRPVRGVDTSNGRVEFFADVAHNGWLLWELGKAKYHGAHLAIRNDDAYALYYDYLTLVVLAGATDDRALETELRAGLRAAYSRFSANDLPGARAALAPLLASPSTSEFVYDAVGHGHLDQAWLWPIRETKRKASRTYARQLANIEERPDFIYGTSQPQQMQWTKERHPALFERMKRAVADGRLELQGSFWVETDTNMPGGESLVRQSIVGRRFLQQEFGLTDEQLRMCWLPDTFGYSGNLPQLLTKSGMDWFQTIKISWNKVNVFPHRTFNWQGIDGSSVLVHMPPEGDYNSRGAADGLLGGLKKYPEKKLNTALLVYGSGDGGGGPNEIHLELTERERDLRGLPKIRTSRAIDFFRRLDARRSEIETTHTGELYLETHQGTYTSQAAIKAGNRLVERKLHEVEALAASLGVDCRERLEPLWREVLLHHFHDILPGSSIERVNREARETHARIALELDAYRGELLGQLPRLGTDASALNLTSMPRSEYVSVGGDWFRAEVEPYAAAALVPAGETPELTIDGDTISNGLLTLRFGSSGEIVSCVDAAGVEHARDGLNRLVLHRDPAQFPWDAWNINAKYLNRSPRVLRPSETTTALDGPTIVRRSLYRFSRSTIEQTVRLEAGSELVQFETRVDWHEKHRMLRTDFRPTHVGETVACEIQFGHLDRTTTERDEVEKAQFEICAHKWVATEDATGGFALLNDSKYGHRVKNGLLSLNLLRSPTFPDKHADQGEHHFTYAFRPYRSGELAPVIRDGYRLNNPLLIERGLAFESIASVDNPAIVIETIKPAESGAGSVIRMYESLGRPATTAVAHEPAPRHRDRDRPARATDRAREPRCHFVHTV